MISKARKKSFFILGLFLTGVFSFFTDKLFFQSYSKNSSLLCKAYADAPPACGSCGCPWTEAQCQAYGNGVGGDAGCCGDTSVSGGGADAGDAD